jgi:hypothetical protein
MLAVSLSQRRMIAGEWIGQIGQMRVMRPNEVGNRPPLLSLNILLTPAT